MHNLKIIFILYKNALMIHNNYIQTYDKFELYGDF